MVRSLFGNSNRKLRSMFWGSPFIPVGTNQTECCLPLTNFFFLLGSRLTRHKFALFSNSNRNGCGISTVNWQIAYHYAFDTPTGFFCQMVSTPCLWNLNFTTNSPVVPHPLSCQISANRNEAETSVNVNKHWNTWKDGTDIITNVISMNQHFTSTFSMQIFKFQRRSCSLSFLFLPHHQSTPSESLLAG